MDVNKQPVDPFNNFPGSGIPGWAKGMKGTDPTHVAEESTLLSRIRALEARLNELEHACRLAGLRIEPLAPADGSDLV